MKVAVLVTLLIATTANAQTVQPEFELRLDPPVETSISGETALRLYEIPRSPIGPAIGLAGVLALSTVMFIGPNRGDDPDDERDRLVDQRTGLALFGTVAVAATAMLLGMLIRRLVLRSRANSRGVRVAHNSSSF